MSVLFGRQRRELSALTDLEPWGLFSRRSGPAAVRVTADTALRHSGVWACLRLRANLISSLPVDVFRKVAGRQVEVDKPGWMYDPHPDWDFTEFMWATQYDLDRFGNAFGAIESKDAAGRPRLIEPVSAGDVSVRTKGRRVVSIVVDGTPLDPSVVWHERQYRCAGSPLGLSPIAYAAWSISGYLSAQQFAHDWYSAGAAPVGVLRHTMQMKIDQDTQESAKARFTDSVRNRAPFITGKDWEWTPAVGDAHSAAFLDEMKYGLNDVARFLDVPGDMIDAEVSTGNVTYRNVTTKNVQLLVTSAGPAIGRRENALSRALQRPRFVKLNTDALLRMDPQTREELLIAQVAGRVRTPSEVRDLANLPPFTEDDYSQFDRVFGAPRAATQTDVSRSGEGRGVEGTS